MPIYEYECNSCQHAFDVLQKVQDEPIKQCPQCHKNTAIRLVSAPGFQLKGTGWYATDFKDKGKAPVSTDKKTDTKSTGSVASASSDVKGEAN